MHSGNGVSRSSGRSASHSLYRITIIQERCLAIRRWSLQVLRQVSLTLPPRNNNNSEALLSTLAWQRNLQILGHVSLTLSVLKNYRNAAFLSSDGISRSPGMSASHPLYGRIAGAALPYCLAMESLGLQACQSNTLCTEELQERCLPVWR